MFTVAGANSFPRHSGMRRFLCLLLTIFMLQGGIVWASSGASARTGRRPNILIILTDDQAAPTMSTMPKTLRWFKRGGRTYRNFFVTTPFCCPSRASLFTGQYAHNHGVQKNWAGGRLVQRTTMQYYLQRNRYKTAMVGKYLSGDLPRDPPFFDKWATFQKPGYYNTRFNVNGRMRDVHGYSTTYLSAKARGIISGFERRDRRPWFLLVSTFAPHFPFAAEGKYADLQIPRWEGTPAQFEGSRRDKPPWVRRANTSFEDGQRIRQRQLRTLKSVDDLVGGMKRRLGRLNERSRTLAFFLSDNGYMWAEHGLRAKEHPYTGSVRTPLFVTWPGHVAPGSVSSRMVGNIDVAPTVLRAAGPLNPAHPIDGRPLFSPGTRERLLLENWPDDFPEWASLRSKRYQFVEYYRRTGGVKFREYYKLRKDPWQLTNVLRDGDPDNSPKVGRLSRRLRRARQCVGSGCP